ncbi:hypothetical protein EVAR_88224_1 [Eumeta japonica]|uniref:BESS domain-containing protein n=1 Tax=Eumeta variegata TaxID=151549 RepID=A0A4C1YXV7_EUMVA|nr:hypothetical protein EVAR_88224_1 [Eumeta japonica]
MPTSPFRYRPAPSHAMHGAASIVGENILPVPGWSAHDKRRCQTGARRRRNTAACKQRWQGLRDAYRRALNKKKRQNSGDTLDVAAFHDTKIQDEDDPIVRIKSLQPQNSRAKKAKAIKKAKVLPLQSASAVLMSRLLDQQAIPQQHDELDRFFLNISETVKKFSPYLQAMAKNKIFTLVSEMELQQLAPPSFENTPQYAYTPSPASTSSCIPASATPMPTSPENWNTATNDWNNQSENIFDTNVLGRDLYTKVLNMDLLTWNFSESGHGKGVADGIGGSVKRTLDKQVAYGRSITNGNEAFEILKLGKIYKVNLRGKPPKLLSGPWEANLFADTNGRRYIESKFLALKNHENMLADYLTTAFKMCYGLTRHQTKKMAFDYAMANGICPDKWKEITTASDDWLKGFMIRHRHLANIRPSPHVTSTPMVAILSTSRQQIISPEIIRPFSKAALRQNTTRNNRKMSSAIITDTPEKYKLEEKEDEVVCTVGDGNFDNCDSPTQDCDGGELTSGTSQFHSTSELHQGDIEQDLSYFQLPNDLGTLHSPMVPITLPNTSKPTNTTNIQAESVNASPALSSTYPSPTPSTSSTSTRVAANSQ